MNADVEAAERHGPRDPRQRLAGEAAPDERLQPLPVAGRAGEELGGLFFRGDKTLAGKERADLRQLDLRITVRGRARPC